MTNQQHVIPAVFSGTGTAAAPLDGKNLDESVPRYLMQPKWAAREGREAAAHSLAQPFLVPLEANGMPVAGAEVTPLGEYAPTTPQVAAFLPLEDRLHALARGRAERVIANHQRRGRH